MRSRRSSVATLDFLTGVLCANGDASLPHGVNKATVDLRLREGSAAVDAGVELPGITDGFTGRAPDLGAYEIGGAPVHYGPRERPRR